MSSTSATVLPDLNTNSGQRAAQPSKSAASKILRVAAPKPSNDQPLTQGTWTQMLDPLTIKFCAAAGDPAINDFEKQKEVVNAIWKRLGDVLPETDFQAMGFVFGVIFDQDADSVPSITLCCSTSASCKTIREELSVIIVDHGRQRASVYAQHSSLDEIPSDLVPIDVCNASVNSSELRSFIDALGSAISTNGSLVGPIRTMLTKINGKGPLERAVRAFVKLNPSAMNGQLYDILKPGKMTVAWKGSDLQIMQLCRHLQCYKAYLAVYPAQLVEFEGEAAGSSSVDASEHSAANSSGMASKKRKSSNE